MSMPDSSPLKPQDAVMYALGELKGQMNAVLASQTAQAEVNAEFRTKLEAHDALLVELTADKRSSAARRVEFLTRLGIFVAAACGIGALIVPLFH